MLPNLCRRRTAERANAERSDSGLLARQVPARKSTSRPENFAVWLEALDVIAERLDRDHDGHGKQQSPAAPKHAPEQQRHEHRRRIHPRGASHQPGLQTHAEHRGDEDRQRGGEHAICSVPNCPYAMSAAAPASIADPTYGMVCRTAMAMPQTAGAPARSHRSRRR